MQMTQNLTCIKHVDIDYFWHDQIEIKVFYSMRSFCLHFSDFIVLFF